MRARGILAAAIVAAALVAAPRAALPEDDDGTGEDVAAPTAHFLGGSPEVFDLPVVHDLGWTQSEVVPGSVDLADEVRGLFGDEVVKEGGRFVEGDGPRIGVRGPAAAVDLFRSRVADLQRALDGRVAVTVSVARLPADAPADLARDALLALVRAEKAEILFAERFDVRRGETVRRESFVRRAFLASLDAEVSQDASIIIPRTMELWTGQRLALHARSLPSGRTAVTLAFHVSRPEGTMRTESTSGGTLELPEVRFLSMTTPFLLSEGETGTARVPDPFGDGTILVRATLTTGPAKIDGPWRVADLGIPAGNLRAESAFVTPGWTGSGTWTDDVAETSGDETWAERVDECASRVTAAALGGESVARGLLVMQNGAALAFEELFASELRTGAVVRTSLRLPTATLATAPWYDPLDGRVTGDVPAGAGRAGPALRLPVRGDTPTLLLVGTWRRVAADMSAEIAQGAVAVAPVVQDHFEGTAVLARLVAAEPGKPPVVDVQCRTAAVLDRTPRAALVRAEISGLTRNDDGSKLDAMSSATSRSRIDVTVRPITTLRHEGTESVLDVWTLE